MNSDLQAKIRQPLSEQSTSVTVSVVIPAYNYGTYVAQCVQSVLDQEHADIEVIVVENGSTDHTREMVRSFRDPRVTLIELDQNIGWAGAIKLGFDHSHGSLVMLLSVDDYLVPSHVAKLVRYLHKHPEIAVVGTWVRVVDANGDPLPEQQEYFSRTVNMEWDPDDMMNWAADHHFQLPSALFRREFLGAALPERGSDRSGDWALHVAVMKQGGRLAVIPEELFCLRLHGSNLSHPDTAWQSTHELSYWFRPLFLPTCKAKGQPEPLALMVERQLTRIALEKFSVEEVAFAARYMLCDSWKGSLKEYLEASAKFDPKSFDDQLWIGLGRVLVYHARDTRAAYRSYEAYLRGEEGKAREECEALRRKNAKLLAKVEMLREKLRMSEKLHSKARKAVERWNRSSWIKRVFHKLRLGDSALDPSLPEPKSGNAME